MGSVLINIANGQLGAALASDDGTVGMVLTGAGEADFLVPKLFTSLAAAENAAITAALEPFAHRQIKDFYTMAGTGSKLYVMLVTPDYNLVQMTTQGNVASVELLLNYAQGKIRVLGVMTDDAAIATYEGDAVTVTGGLNTLVYSALASLTVIAEAYATAQTPFRAVIGGTSYNGTSGDLTDLTTYTKNRISVLLGDTVSGIQACLGLLMGKIATLPVMRKVSRVRDGALPITAAYLGTENMASLTSVGDPEVIAGNGFITLKTYPNLAGYFFEGDPTASATNDDYHLLARGRVIDKAHRLAYMTYVQEVDDEVPINEDGTLDAGYCKHLEGIIVNQIEVSMKGKREISGVTCYVDPAQNVLATNEVTVGLGITPVGYATEIIVNLGFRNPAA